MTSPPRRTSRRPLDPAPADGWVLPGDGRYPIRWSGRTLVLGILNLTPDSFSDGGRFIEPEKALDRALQMQEEGADLIDVGGESTRPGSKGVSPTEEKRRVLPVIRLMTKKLKVPISIDTSKASVAEAAVDQGARMLNDVGALRLDPQMPRVAARLKVPVILMHMAGRPRTMQKSPRYRDVVGEVATFLQKRMDAAIRSGIDPRNIILDPGFGFGKTAEHNLELVRRLGEFRVLGRPLLMGASRKATLGLLLGGAPPFERVEASVAVAVASVLAGADFVRVHDVKETVRSLRVADALRYP